MDSWKDGNWLSIDINTGENLSSLRDTGESYGKLIGRQVMELQVDVVLVATNASLNMWIRKYFVVMVTCVKVSLYIFETVLSET